MRNLSILLALLAVAGCGTPAAGVHVGAVVPVTHADADAAAIDAGPDAAAPVDALADGAAPVDVDAGSVDNLPDVPLSPDVAGDLVGVSDVADAADTAQPDATLEPPAPPGMVLIPAGTFWMGCNEYKDSSCDPDEKPQHKVTLSAYYMDVNEVTVADYKKCVDADVCTVPYCWMSKEQGTWGVAGKEQNPVNCITWPQSQQYCQWRGGGFDLPTEAQWEMAARGNCELNGLAADDIVCLTAMRTYPWGEDPPTCDYAVMSKASGPAGSGCGTAATWPVGSRPKGDSPYGVHDMAGNLSEWIRDQFGSYAAGDQTNPAGPGNKPKQRAVRGGSFLSDAGSLRAGSRGYNTPSNQNVNFGARCVWSPSCADVSCPDLPCATQHCDPGSGKCVATPKVDLIACDDGNPCTTVDSCVVGVCTGAVPKCDDGKACTKDSCDTLGVCAHVAVSAGTPCGMGGVCDAVGTCSTLEPPDGMVQIPPGTFWMGCNAAKDANCTDAEKPQHKVTLSGYYMDMTETTVAQYQACVATGACTAVVNVLDYGGCNWGAAGKAQNPVNCLTWEQAQQYCQSRGPAFDLPTEAQWEMAARGSCEKNGSTAADPTCAQAMRTYPWGEAVASCSTAVMTSSTKVWGCGKNGTWPVGSLPAGDSPYGLHDMAGNIAEVVRDYYAAPYPAGDQSDPVGPLSGDKRIVRGASFGTAAVYLRSAGRGEIAQGGSGYSGMGMRCIWSPGCATSCPDVPCATQACDTGSGKCVATPMADGSSCDDGNPCTVGDACKAAKCVSGAAANCYDANACTADSCDPAKGCLHTPIAAGTPCGAGGTCDGAGSCSLSAPPGMVQIPGGTFWMGCNASKDKACSSQGTPEKPQHKVTLSPYAMDLTETTREQYKACVDAGVCTWSNYPGVPNSPVTHVSWTQSRQYCQWRGAGFDLPTEAQWEMAARGSCEMNGSSAADPNCKTAMRTYPWGEAPPTCSYAVIADQGSYGCGTNKAWAVGSLPAGDSPYGLHDMAGNALEWTRDASSLYAAGDQVDPVSLANNDWRVMRSGSYAGYSVRAGARVFMAPATANWTGIGLRCAFTPGCANVTCPPDEPCVVHACDPGAGKCVAVTVANGQACEDGKPCTAGEKCQDAACTGGTPAKCDDGNACTTDSCDLSTGCTHTDLPDWTPCGQGMVCNGSGVCQDVKAVKGMAFIPAGTFWMGCNAAKDSSCSDDEKPQHKVTLSAYYADLTETTVAQFQACVDAKVCVPALSAPPTANFPKLTSFPMNYISWTGAQAYCKWRGGAFDLPTEAQWEMAARGSCEKNGSTPSDPGCAAAMRTYPWGEAVSVNCSHAVAGCGSKTAAVGSKPLGDSPYGLHDMDGNVREWVRDWYGPYTAGDQGDPVGADSGTQRVERGGDYINDAFRASFRDAAWPYTVDGMHGMRCVRAYP